MNQFELIQYMKKVYPKWVSTGYVLDNNNETSSNGNMSVKFKKLERTGFLEKRKQKGEKGKVIRGIKHNCSKHIQLWRIKKEYIYI